jgi:hypothetical protein
MVGNSAPTLEDFKKDIQDSIYKPVAVSISHCIKIL